MEKCRHGEEVDEPELKDKDMGDAGTVETLAEATEHKAETGDGRDKIMIFDKATKLNSAIQESSSESVSSSSLSFSAAGTPDVVLDKL